MKSLQIREVPDHIYLKLQHESKKERRSLSQQAIVTLAVGLETKLSPKERRKKLLSKIRENSTKLNLKYAKSPTEMIREDRKHSIRVL